ncbi:acetylornithine deacetylase [Proteobacteria bacterium 005FR1]|nr:acetylornithine deacetylase [Proteobacteria bacterium 005FR1]
MNLLKSYRDRLSQLVAVPSVSSPSAQWDMGNRGVIDVLANWCNELGFATEVMPIPGRPNKANLIATLGSGPGGLVLAGHTDTVPYDENRWQHDPFRLTEQNDRLYGLGATDMKGFFPVALAAAEQFAKGQLQQPLIILATADEESSMDGARLLTQLGRPKGRYAVVGEPTGLKPVRMHKGIMMESVRIQGLAGHSSNPALGKNAMEAMHLVIGDLLAFRTELQSRYNNPGFDVAIPTLNLGHIHGGDNPNRICGHCELHFDLRPLPGMQVSELREVIDRRFDAIRETTGTQILCEALIGGVDPFEESADSALVQAVEKLTGHQAESVAFATEAAFMQQLGMETIVFGPGSIDQAHQPDEFIPLDQVQPAVDALTDLVQRFCVEGA